ncbi:hypothetical protein KEM54_000052 [Ascosphaera aggregata]|nr:hypothetical protein KEM54_000052 [Ascosphaera aggregata]
MLSQRTYHSVICSTPRTVTASVRNAELIRTFSSSSSSRLMSPSSSSSTTSTATSRDEEVLASKVPSLDTSQSKQPNSSPSRSSSVNATSFFNTVFTRKRSSGGDTATSKSSPEVQRSAKTILDDIFKYNQNTPGTTATSELTPSNRNRYSHVRSTDLASNIITRIRRDLRRYDIRSNPSTGRSVDVNHKTGMDPVRAVRTLEILCARNKVRVHQRDQKFHVRRTQKRKDLRMKRWRALFKKSFKQTLSRCAKMKSQGW